MYWYEFPAWWRRQIALRARGFCPDWAKPIDDVFRHALRAKIRKSGLILIAAGAWETTGALADDFQRAGYATVWQPSNHSRTTLGGVAAGVWDGGQLDEREADDLTTFSRRLGRQRAPVITLLDFPRRDRADRAMEAGAAAVLGKPWSNAALIETIEGLIERRSVQREHRKRAA
jgi:hypothetical protein